MYGRTFWRPNPQRLTDRLTYVNTEPLFDQPPSLSDQRKSRSAGVSKFAARSLLAIPRGLGTGARRAYPIS